MRIARSSSTVVDEEEEGDPEGSDIYNGISIPELGGYARTYTSARPTEYFFLRVQSYASADLRSGEYSNDATSARGGSGNLAWRWLGYDPADTKHENRQVMWFSTCASTHERGRPWLGNKFWCFGMYNTRDSNNYKIFRYADAVLMMAEAWLMKGDTERACAYLNITRTRAGLDPMSYAAVGNSIEALMEEIRMERARELFGEYQRKFDLVRWGIWYERTLQHNDGLYIKNFMRPYHRYWPIPAEQITYSGGALDNNEYNE